ncbi:MAG: sulfotransferase family protein [Alphaproteobacteria bacterium]
MTAAADAPLLIVGCPRSGTTLAATLLESRFGFAVPAETQFIPYFARAIGLWGDLSNPANRHLLLDAVFQFLEIWVARALPAIARDTILPQTLLSVRPDAQAIVAGASSYADLVRGLFEAYARRHGRARWAEKSAYATPVSLDALERVFPGMRIVHLVRDPRDVCLSWRKTDTPPPSLAGGARLWRWHLRASRAWGAANGQRYLEIRYEDLALAPTATVDRLGGFLGTPPSPTPAESALARVMQEFPSQAQLASPILGRSVGLWLDHLAPEDVRTIESIASADMAATGHQTSGQRPNLATLVQRELSRAAPLIRGVSWRRGAKILLPLAIRLAQYAGQHLPARLAIR